jgi:hypothetical protein
MAVRSNSYWYRAMIVNRRANKPARKAYLFVPACPSMWTLIALKLHGMVFMFSSSLEDPARDAHMAAT